MSSVEANGLGTAVLLAALGSSLALVLSAAGAAYGTLLSSKIIVLQTYSKASTANDRRLAMVPTVMSGVLAIYGLIMSVLIAAAIGSIETEEKGYRMFAAGLTTGGCCLFSGIAIGQVCSAFASGATVAVGVTRTKPASAATADSDDLLIQDAQAAEDGDSPAPKGVPVTLILTLIFSESIGLYGLISSLLIINTA